MAILVTGGAGFIGSHTCLELLCQGYDILVIDNLDNSYREAVKRVETLAEQKIPFYVIDLLDITALKQVFVEHSIDAVVHFAGLKAVGESVEQPVRYYHNNLTGTFNLLNCMAEFKVYQLVFSSSATVYGDPSCVPITELASYQPANPYGQTKFMIEQVLNDLAQSSENWSLIALRYFNPVGAHSSGLIGEDPQGTPNNLMPYISQVAIGQRAQLSIFGQDYPTKDGTGVRDYIHVVDLAQGHVAALNYLANFTGFDAINLGAGQGYSVLEMVAAFEQASSQKIPYHFAPRREGDIAECYADITAAKDKLNWQAKKGLDDMMSDTWRWQSTNPYGYKKISESA